MRPTPLTRADAIKISTQLRHQRQSIAFVNGCFDPLHHGHIRLFQYAKAKADVLFVAVNSDASIQRIKGIHRPRLPLVERISSLAELRSVDYIVDFDEDTATEIIQAIRPNYVVKGGDYDKTTTIERTIIHEIGACLCFAQYVHGISSTRIVDSSSLHGKVGRSVHLVADLALDTYVFAEANSLSREFPSVVCVKPTENSVLGGGGNLASNLKRQAALTSVISVVGESETDEKILKLVGSLGVKNTSLTRVAGPYGTCYKKIVAKRSASASQEILRLDEIPVRPNMEVVWDSVKDAILRANIQKGDIIVISSYDDLPRSVIGPPVRSFLRGFASERGALLIGACRSSCRTLQGFDIIVLNEQEVLESVGKEYSIGNFTPDLVRLFSASVSPSHVVVTTGERGAIFCSAESSELITVSTMACPPGTDPTGAGDVFLAALVGSVSRGTSLADSASLAVRCATNALFNRQRPAIAEHLIFDM